MMDRIAGAASVRARSAAAHSKADNEDAPNLADSDFAAAVAHGMTLQPKRIASKWLYDDEGARLFDAIVASPGYCVARAETAILRERAAAVAQRLGPDASIVELGSGSSAKVRVLLDALEAPRCYVPIEISEAQLLDAAEAIRRDYPGLTVAPLAADYSQAFALPRSVRGRPLIAFFPGSTLCNQSPGDSVDFLRRMDAILGPGALFLVGVDLRKDEAVMLRAYNDPGGPIWRFNLNVVERMNREFGAGLDRDAFRHEAIYDRVANRIEAAIYPLKDMAFTVAGRPATLAAGEPIVLEHSHKYRIEEFQAPAGRAGWTPVEAWTDCENLFSVHLLGSASG